MGDHMLIHRSQRQSEIVVGGFIVIPILGDEVVYVPQWSSFGHGGGAGVGDWVAGSSWGGGRGGFTCDDFVLLSCIIGGCWLLFNSEAFC